MLWLVSACASYICFAVSALFTKYLVSQTALNPKIFISYVGILGAFVFVLIPFVGFSIPSPFQLVLSVSAGFALSYATFCLLQGLQKFEASRLVPAIGGLVPIFIFLFVFVLSRGRETFSLHEGIAFLFLIGGTIFLTFGKNTLADSASLRTAFQSAFFIALSIVIAKYVYLLQPFWSGFILMRLGGLLLSMLFFVFSKEVRSSLFLRKPVHTSFVFILSQAVGGLAELLRNLAIFLVPLSILPFVSALQGIEYAFLFVFVFLLSRYFPHIVKEEVTLGIVLRKALFMACILMGLWILAFV